MRRYHFINSTVFSVSSVRLKTSDAVRMEDNLKEGQREEVQKKEE